MSTIKSSSDHLTINADGASKDIKFQANGVEKASITKLTGTLPAISGANLTSLPGGGKVLQVITDTASAVVNTTSGTWSDLGITVTITPSATTSKILVMTHCLARIGASNSAFIGMRLLRDSTALMEYGRMYERHGYDISTIIPFIYLDSPSSTSALTYKVQGSNPGGSGNTKFVQDISNQGVATITVMEIGA